MIPIVPFASSRPGGLDLDRLEGVPKGKPANATVSGKESVGIEGAEGLEARARHFTVVIEDVG
jgi:hypothetical protein